MRFYYIVAIIIIVTILPYVTLHYGRPAIAALKSFAEPRGSTADNTKSIGSNLTLQEVEELLQEHNKARAEVGVGPLHWSKQLAIYAVEWADHLAATKCRMQHRSESGQWKQEHGENLFMGTAGYYGVADAVKAWVSEKKYYKGGTLTASDQRGTSGNWHASGHYTQVVWGDTKQLGCAKVECKGNIIVVCNYDPPGNVLGQKPY